MATLFCISSKPSITSANVGALEESSEAIVESSEAIVICTRTGYTNEMNRQKSAACTDFAINETRSESRQILFKPEGPNAFSRMCATAWGG